MQDQVCLVTGANSGIGMVTALELARRGATLLMVCRSRSKGEAARAAIVAQSGNERVELFLADFASLAAVRRLAAEIAARHQHIHVLVNNAGLYLGEYLMSQDGYEMTLAVNHLAPFLLTNLLLGQLKAAAPARIITVSSGAHMAGRINFADLQYTRGYSGWRAYADSKLANVLFTYALARRLAGSGVTANCLHPGAVATNFAGDTGGLTAALFRLGRVFMLTSEQGAQTSIYLATSPEVTTKSGGYYVSRRLRRSLPASYNEQLQERFWQASAELVGL